MRKLWIVILGLFVFPAAAVAADEDVAVVSTPYGEIVWRFLPEAAPGHVAYVKELIDIYGKRFPGSSPIYGKRAPTRLFSAVYGARISDQCTKAPEPASRIRIKAPQ